MIDNLLKVPWYSSELQKVLKKYIYYEFSNNIKIGLLKNSFNYIIAPFIEQLNNYFIDSYKYAMKQDPEFIKKATETATVSFDKISDKINKYNEKIKNRKEEDTPKEIKREELPKDIKNPDENEEIVNDISNIFKNRHNK